MQYVKFGNTGMDVSRICLGMMSFGKPGKENGVFPWARDYDDAKPLFRRQSTSASTTSTPPTSTRWAPARKLRGN